jgi:hypothetical protein
VAVRLAELSGWQTATRQDARVAQALHADRAMDRVYAVHEAAFFDEFFHYLKTIGAWPWLEDLDPHTRERVTYPFIQFVQFLLMRCVGGVQSMLATHDVLLTDEALMATLGFNAVQVREGCTQRGVSRRSRPVEIRGPFSFETVADNIVAIAPAKLAAMFNGIIRCLAAQGIFAKQLDVVLDATDDEATPHYKTDDGRPVPHVRREKRPDVRANRHAQKVEVTVFGWKVWLVWEPLAQVPLAMVIDDIQEPDNKHALAALQQAKRNVAGFATIRSVAMDRGFLDGKLLSAIAAEHIHVTIPARADMTITAEARAIARRAQQAAAGGRTLDGCTYQERHQRVTRGAGKNARQQTETTTVVGIRGLPCDWWSAEGSSSKANSKSFQPKLLNATVVLRWDGAPKEADKEVVLLTTNPAPDPFAAFDAYDDRSLIENSCNREAKERWFLEHHPKRTEAAVRVHAFFVFACMALVAGFRAYRARSDEQERRGQDTGIARYRRRLAVQNRDKVAVFIGEHYGVFQTYEVFVLVGITIRDQEALGETPEVILRRYGVASPERIDSS